MIYWEEIGEGLKPLYEVESGTGMMIEWRPLPNWVWVNGSALVPVWGDEMPFEKAATIVRGLTGDYFVVAYQIRGEKIRLAVSSGTFLGFTKTRPTADVPAWFVERRSAWERLR